MKVNREEKKVELSSYELRHLLEHFCSLNEFCKSLLYCAGLQHHRTHKYRLCHKVAETILSS